MQCSVCFKTELAGRRLVCDSCLIPRRKACREETKQGDTRICRYNWHHKTHPGPEHGDGCLQDHTPDQPCCICGEAHRSKAAA